MPTIRRPVDYPWVLVRLRCDVCKRAGAYRLARLAVKYGAEILLDDLIVRLSSDCPWRDEPRGTCGARFSDLPPRRPPDLPARAMRVIAGVSRRPGFTLDLCSLFVLNGCYARAMGRDRLACSVRQGAVSVTSVESHPATRQPSAIGGTSDDRFLWGFPLFALCCEVFLAALTYLERIRAGSFLVMLLFLALVVVIMLVIAVVGVIALLRGRSKRAATLLLAPFIIATPFLFPVLRYEEFAFDLIRFHFTQGTYAEVVDGLSPAERASRILFFDWGNEGFVASAGSQYWLVYDESGEIALPVEERSQSWKERANKEKRYFSDEKCLAEAHRLSGDYYSAAMRCPY